MSLRDDLDGPCALCGHAARGYATVDHEGREVRLCHPGAGQDCYGLWTVYGYRPISDRPRPLTADELDYIKELAYRPGSDAAPWSNNIVRWLIATAETKRETSE